MYFHIRLRFPFNFQSHYYIGGQLENAVVVLTIGYYNRKYSFRGKVFKTCSVIRTKLLNMSTGQGEIKTKAVFVPHISLLSQLFRNIV